MTKINTANTPVWDLTLTIRGRDVPTLSPLDAADRSVVNLGPRKAGAIVRLWRYLVGEPRRAVEDAHETRELRRTLQAAIAPEHADLVAELSGGEIMAALSSYLGAQSAWAAEIQRRAYDELSEAIGRSAKQPAPVSTPPTPTPTGSVHHHVPPTPLVPGALPAWLAGAVERSTEADG